MLSGHRPLGASVDLLSIDWIRHGHRGFTEPPKGWATGRQVATGEAGCLSVPAPPRLGAPPAALGESSQALVAAMAVPWLSVPFS